LFLTFLSILSCASTVPPGSVVLQVNIAASDESGRYNIVHGGRYWGGPNTSYYELPVVEQRAVWCKNATEGSTVDDSITFAGKDGQPVNSDIGIGYSLALDDKDIIHMVQTYGYDLHLTIEGRVRDSVRNAMNLCASEYTVEDLYGSQKGPLMDCALAKVKTEYEPNGLLIHRLTLNSEIRLPKLVKEAMEPSNAAIQQAAQVRNEVESTKATGEKTVAAATAEAESLRVRSEAEAHANEVLANSITPALIELKRIEVQKSMIEKWDGRLPQNTFGDATPLIDVTSTISAKSVSDKKE